MIGSSPDDVGPVLALARTLEARGDSKPAVEELRAVLDRFPDSIDVRAALGRVLLTDNRNTDVAIALGELLDALDRGGVLEPREKLE